MVGDEQNRLWLTPLLKRRWRLTPIVWRPAAFRAGAGAGDSIRPQFTGEDETRTQERSRRGEVVGAVSIRIRRCPAAR